MQKKRAIFVDRDGTIIKEPPVDYQVDSLEKLSFVRGAISGMKALRMADYELVLVSNQDGLGTESFPMDTFLPAHNKMLETLAAEGVGFDDQLIDPTLPEENAPTRKPGIGMFGKYLGGEYDLAASWVIGDRATDVQLAKNLGARAILFQAPEDGAKILKAADMESADCELISNDWADVAERIRRSDRVVEVVRNTRETKIRVAVDLDGRMESRIDTGLKFFDHMLDQIVHHAGIGLCVEADGDLEVDEHHTMEDVAITLGEAVLRALGDKRGIGRYGFALPMDESDALVLLDFGGRIDVSWRVPFTRDMVGDVPTEMFEHFFKALAAEMRCNLHIEARGENNHHLAEAVFKAFARALKAAVRREPFNYDLPSSKGVL
ncbi:MAG: bifunctional histidinol-phosphatase/imidazoleglycerol-phosphate dehydratase HisB [Tidjanibacter sp.]|nr:bifunctional histidinol-phosphatase/imidazoleglycerol-phosphate dehydratase HisB [Tidjanibacter sp.]